MKILSRLILSVLICTSVLTSCSQERKLPYYDQIQEYKRDDQKSFPAKNGILFVGSSSIRLWKTLKTDFEGFNVINRGFGGSKLTDAINYADDIITPYHPKQVVIYSGENDIADGKATSADIMQRFEELFTKIRKALPDAHIVYISIKPSPSREKFLSLMEESNEMIREFLSGHPETSYVDIYHLMLDGNGKPRRELFVGDQLHMNKQGYAIWREAVMPVLKRQTANVKGQR